MFCFFSKEDLKPGKYIITHDYKGRDVQSRNGISKYSDKANLYSKGMEVHIVDLVHHKPDKRIRGQIKDSEDWISLQNTENGYMWAEPCITVIIFFSLKVFWEIFLKITKNWRYFFFLRIWG